MNSPFSPRHQVAKVALRGTSSSVAKLSGFKPKSTRVSRSKQHAQRMAHTAPAFPSIWEQTEIASPKKALPDTLLEPESHYLLKSSLIDTVRVVVDARRVSLEKLTEANSRVKRDGFKYIVSFPQEGTTATLLQFKKKNKLLYIEFSAPKLLTGQNIIGIHDLHVLCVSGIRKIFAAIDFPRDTEFKKQIGRGGYRLSRVDVTAHIACGTALRATALMRSFWQMLASQPESMKSVSAFSLETFYVTQASGYSTFKLYRKDLELLTQPLPASVFARELLTERAAGLVRIEYTMRSPCLKHLGLSDPLAWNAETVQQQLQPWIDRLVRVGGAVPDVALMEKLPNHLQQKLAAWLHGDKLAFIRGVTVETTRENRNTVLKTTGIDVGCDLTPDEQKQCLLTLRELVQQGFALKSNDKVWPRFLAGAQSVAARPDRSCKSVRARVSSAKAVKRKTVR